jgi:hypothetical protein
MTKLESVNRVLRRAGGYPVNSLDTNGPSAAAEAERCIDESAKIILQREWNFNTRSKVTLTPDVNGYIAVPAGTLHLDTDGNSEYRNITYRGQRLFDVTNNTEIFSGPITVLITSLWEFHCIPEPVADYITAEAAFNFNAARGVAQNEARLVNELVQMRNKAVAWNSRQHDVNLLDSFHSQDVKGGRRFERTSLYYS